ncbi:cobalamin biosynthesis protein CobD [Bacillus sp. V3-13]|uniref:adenosylcobinamide-phosphate synthase CbiB n=1 Tax=Bacillus sp. V3-13 TaxID=2053728 RepID=UPI000C77B5BC|nr:adenosylcobinamide-phosphate synthase CbiB [Bacillus sp. V3-13]PLR77321.1 cobalamin biosynthesis protein CobD [Bacillus sp. V3-13]
MILHHLAAVTIAFIIDGLVGDPPRWPHPVRWMGSLIAYVERKWNKGQFRKLKGIGMVLIVLTVVMLITAITVICFYRIHPAAGIAWEAILISATIAQRSLQEAALEVYKPLKAGEINEARKKLSYIVGRDTEGLSQEEIVRGTVETVAENTSDGVTAPLFWGLLGGAVFSVAYRAINTCDSMVGYRNEKYREFGWASARLDDVVNWVPSRLTSLMMILCMKPAITSRTQACKILFRDAKKHPSPNSGWCEAACAAILGVQLGGTNYYKGIVSVRAKMGDPILPLENGHILLSITLMKRASLLFLLLLWLGGVACEYAIARF